MSLGGNFTPLKPNNRSNLFIYMLCTSWDLYKLYLVENLVQVISCTAELYKL